MEDILNRADHGLVLRTEPMFPLYFRTTRPKVRREDEDRRHGGRRHEDKLKVVRQANEEYASPSRYKSPSFVNNATTVPDHEQDAQRIGDERERDKRQERQFETLSLGQRPSRLKSYQQVPFNM